MRDELADATARYDELQKISETQRSTWLADKKQLEDTIVDMSTSEKHQESDRASRETEVKQLEDRAKVIPSNTLLFIRLTSGLSLPKIVTRVRFSRMQKT